ncbi:HAD family hydrolase [Microbacterium sp. NRRL B-14842]|uniref:HAD family hydrolase n=1 Tax=Microbacterium sp. NRRL B-14842 TaxID=3162881 RepID=UPI003D2725C4
MAGAETADEVLALAAAAEADSEHPLAKAIVRAARDKELPVPASRDFSSLSRGRCDRDGGRSRDPGRRPASAHGGGRPGAPRRGGLACRRCDHPARAAGRPGRRGAQARGRGASGVAGTRVDALHALGVQVVMITGDAEAVAHTVAADLGIDRVFAGVRRRTRRRRCRSCSARAARSRWWETA